MGKQKHYPLGLTWIATKYVYNLEPPAKESYAEIAEIRISKIRLSLSFRINKDGLQEEVGQQKANGKLTHAQKKHITKYKRVDTNRTSRSYLTLLSQLRCTIEVKKRAEVAYLNDCGRGQIYGIHAISHVRTYK